MLREAESRISGFLRRFISPLILLVDGEHEESIRQGTELYASFPDPEGRLHFARNLAWAGHPDRALAVIEQIASSYAALAAPGCDPWLASVDTTERYRQIYDRTLERRNAHRERFRAHPASKVIGQWS